MARPSPEAMEAERARVRQKSESESARRDHIRGSTRPSAFERAHAVEDFVRSGKLASYPALDEDLADEASVPAGKGAPRLWLEAEIQRAYMSVGAADVAPSTLAQWLLTSHDEAYSVDVEHLPLHAATPDRVLGHLESLGLGLSPRLAATIARRASLLLMNHDRGGSNDEKETAPRPPPVEAGRSVPAAAPRLEGEGSEAGGDREREEARRLERTRLLDLLARRADSGHCPAGRAHEVGPQARPSGEGDRASARAPGTEVVGSVGERRHDAGSQDRSQPPRSGSSGPMIPAPDPPPPKADPSLYPQMVLDFTEGALEVSYAGNPDAPDPKPRRGRPGAARPGRAELEVRGYVQAKEDMAFRDGPSTITLPAGLVLELVKPTERDQRDLDRLLKAKSPHAVVRWRGMTRLVPDRCIRRVPDDAWTEQRRSEERNA